jgi:dTDP-4-dehydrorhamnose reductase
MRVMPGRAKIMVTGAAGQVGSALLRLSAAEPVRLIALRREQLDLSDPARVTAVCEDVEPDIVVNTAAYTAVDRAEEEPELALTVNAEGPGHLARWCCARRRPLIHVSSDYVFSGTSTTPYKEGDPIAPLNVYGRSKAIGEHNIRQSGAPHVIIRTAWVYAAAGQNFVRTMLKLGRERNEVSVVNDQWGSPTYAEDLAKAIYVVVNRLLSDTPVSGTFHYAGSGEATWFHFAQFIFDHAEICWRRRPKVTPISTSDFVTLARRPSYSVLDTSLYRSTFGDAPPPWQCSAKRALEMIFARDYGTE